MKFTSRFVALALSLAVLPGEMSARPPSRAIKPVIVGAEAELNGCTSIGHGKVALTVRAAPAPAARVISTLGKTHLVWICEQREGSKWLGIVYGPAAISHRPTGVPPACGVDAPIASPRPYRGRCRSGWVRSAAVVTIAG